MKYDFKAIYDHFCEIIRPNDLLKLQYYFINLKPVTYGRGRNKKTRLKKIQKQVTLDNKTLNLDAYVVIRIPQQHVLEEYIKTKVPDKTIDSFISGPSYVTFKIPQKAFGSRSYIPYTKKYLLTWGNFELLNYSNASLQKPTILKKSNEEYSYPLDWEYNDLYPESKHENLFINTHIPYTLGNGIPSTKKIPLTLFDIPRKIILSPYKEKKGHFFSFHDNNSEKQLLKQRGYDTRVSKTALYELWSNQLEKNKDGIPTKSLDFKAIAYALNDNEDNEVKDVMPNEVDRKELSHLTTEFPRVFKSNYFLISGLGASAKLSYKYPIPAPDDFSITTWAQEINYGRDTLIQKETLWYDLNTGLRVIVIKVAYRTFRNGMSYLRHRCYMKYKDTYINYQENPKTRYSLPFKEIHTQTEGTFFTSSKKLTNNENGLEAYSVLTESQNSKYPKNILKLPYLIKDMEGNEHHIKMDMVIVPHNSPISYDEINRGIEQINIKKALNENYHLIKIIEKIAFAKGSKENGDTYLETNGIFFYSSFDGKINNKFIFHPHLMYVKAYIPHLKGIEKERKDHNLMYSRSYMDQETNNLNVPSQGFDSSSVFMKLLSPDFNASSVFNNSLDKNQVVFDRIHQHQNPLYGAFSQNIQNTGAMINTDFPIEGISTHRLGILAKESYQNKEIQDASKQLLNIRPSDFLGKDAELIGGISLIDLFNPLLEEIDHPVVKVINEKIDDFEKLQNEYQEVVSILESSYTEKVEEIKKLKQDLLEIPNKIKRLEQDLIETARNVLMSKIDQYIEKWGLYERLKIIQENIDENVYILERKFHQEFITDILNAYQITEICNFSIEDFIEKVTKLPTYIKENDLKAINILKIYLSILIKEDLRFCKPGGTEVVISKKLYNIVYLKLFYGLFNTENYVTTEIDLEPVKDLLIDLKESLEKEYDHQYNILINVISEVYEKTDIYWSKTYTNTQKELEKIERVLDTSEEYKSKFEDLIKSIQSPKLFDQVNSLYINEYNKLKGYQKRYEDHKKVLSEKWDDVENRIQEIKNTLLFRLKKKGLDLLAEHTELKDRYEEFYNQLTEKAFDSYLSYIRKYNAIHEDLEKNANHYLETIDGVRIDIERKIEQQRQAIDLLKKEIENALGSLSNFIKETLNDKVNELKDKITGTEEYKKTIKLIDQIKAFNKLINGTHQQKLKYTLSTSNLKDFDAGFVKIVTKQNPKTKLEVDFEATSYFNVATPSILEKQEVAVSTGITNIGINFLDLITVNFDKFSYQRDINDREKYDVKIRDVQFQGIFNFISAFEEYLKDIGNSNLILDITSTGITMGYQYPLGSPLIFGYFNIYNLNFNILFHQSFLPKVPMTIKFGINNKSNPFIVQVNGYPGTGYFLITLNPKEGITHIIFIIEFKASTSFNLGVAKGYASVNGGIYYLKENNQVEIKAYVLCHGNFSILNLFNSAITFNLVLKLENGNQLKGSCVMEVSYKFTPWFKLEVGVYMEHNIKSSSAKMLNGIHRTKQELALQNDYKISEEELTILFEDVIVETNMTHKNYFEKGEEIYLIYKSPLEDTDPIYCYSSNPTLKLNKKILFEDEITKEKYYEYSGTARTSNQYNFMLKHKNKELTLNKNISDTEKAKSWEEYFKSCYY